MKGADERYPLAWIDEYVERIRDYVVVREEDCLLIKVPNEAHKLNASGVAILKRLLSGESVLELWASRGRSPEVQRDLYEFFVGLKQVLQGCVNEHRLPESVVSKPFSLGFNTLPVLSELALTYRCNLRCRFCYASCGCTRSDGHAGEVTTDEARRLLRVIREDAQVPSVSFTGGEPTLRNDLCALVRCAREEFGLRVNLITNGSLIDEAVARRLKNAGLHSAQVSLESPDGAVHDELTQVDGSYNRTLAAIGHLLESGIRVHTNTTLNQVNATSVGALPGFVRSLGLERFSMNLIIPAGSSRAACPDIHVRYADARDVILHIKEEAQRCGVEFMWYSPTPVCIFNPIQHQLGNKGCAACDGLLSISPTGDVLPCSSWSEPVGNLLREDFRRVWDSARARWLREKAFAPALCQECDDFALCQGGCPLYWRHFGYEELEQYGGRYAAATG